MSESSTPQTDPSPEAPRDEVIERVEKIIASLLWWGVMISLALMISGTLVSFLHSGRYGNTPDDLKRLTTSTGDFPRTVSWFVDGLGHFRGQALIVLGLLLLILTPLLRVGVSVVAYLIERDWVFVLITSLVLALLGLSILLGGHG